MIRQKLAKKVLLASSLLFSWKQDLLNNLLVQVPVNPNHQWNMQVQDEVFSSVAKQDIDTSGYQLSDLEVIHFPWEDSDVNVDVVLQSGIDTLFSFKFQRIQDGISGWQSNFDWRQGRPQSYQRKVTTNNLSSSLTQEASQVAQWLFFWTENATFFKLFAWRIVSKVD